MTAPTIALPTTSAHRAAPPSTHHRATAGPPRPDQPFAARAPSRGDHSGTVIAVRGREEAPSDPTALACSIGQAAVESLRGVRPVSQLARWLAPEVFEALVARSQLTLAAGPGPTRPARIRRARIHRVSARAAEATVVVDDLGRVRALAMRLEHHRGAWRVVALVLG